MFPKTFVELRRFEFKFELFMYDIAYKPRTIIKAQALSNFVGEWTETQLPPPEHELEY
jgi:hypothetical protein